MGQDYTATPQVSPPRASAGNTARFGDSNRNPQVHLRRHLPAAADSLPTCRHCHGAAVTVQYWHGHGRPTTRTLRFRTADLRVSSPIRAPLTQMTAPTGPLGPAAAPAPWGQRPRLRQRPSTGSVALLPPCRRPRPAGRHATGRRYLVYPKAGAPASGLCLTLPLRATILPRTPARRGQTAARRSSARARSRRAPRKTWPGNISADVYWNI